MTKTKINVKELNNSIENYKKQKRKLIDDLNGIYGVLKNVDGGWNDSNSSVFLKTIKNNKYTLDNYFDDLDILFNKLYDFKNKIDYLCIKEGYKKDSSSLMIDSDKVDLVISKMNKVITYLNNAKYYIGFCVFTTDFKQLYRVNLLKNTINNVKNMAYSVIRKLETFDKNFNKIVSTYQIEVSKVSNFNLNIKPLEYLWKSQEVKFISKNVEQIQNASAKNNKFNIEHKGDLKLNQQNVNQVNVDINGIMSDDSNNNSGYFTNISNVSVGEVNNIFDEKKIKINANYDTLNIKDEKDAFDNYSNNVSFDNIIENNKVNNKEDFNIENKNDFSNIIGVNYMEKTQSFESVNNELDFNNINDNIVKNNNISFDKSTNLNFDNISDINVNSNQMNVDYTRNSVDVSNVKQYEANSGQMNVDYTRNGVDVSNVKQYEANSGQMNVDYTRNGVDVSNVKQYEANSGQVNF